MSLKNISLVGRWPALLSRGLSGIISHRQPLCMAVAVQHYSYVDLLIHGVEIAMAGRCTGKLGRGAEGIEELLPPSNWGLEVNQYAWVQLNITAHR